MRWLLALATVLVPMGLASADARQKDDPKLARTRMDIKTLEKAVAVYQTKNGTFPPSLEDLTKGKDRLVDTRDLSDPWKQPYKYDPSQLTKKGLPFIWSEGPKDGGPKGIIGNFEPGDKKNTLYERLGSEKGITQIVEDIFTFVVADPKIRKEHKDHFKMGDVASLKRKMIDQIGEATGGPQKYKGKNMKDAHKGMKITDADFNALMEDITKALVKNKVDAKDLRTLIKALQSMRKDVVEVPAKSSQLRPALERATLGS